MGRMIDILRTADRRPVAGQEAVVRSQESAVKKHEPVGDDGDSNNRIASLTQEPPVQKCELPPIEDDNNVPFIEVGGKRETTLRLVSAPYPALGLVKDEKNLTPQPLSLRAKAEQETKPESSPPFPLREGGTGGLGSSPSSPPALFTIRFEPIHAARIGGRSFVAELIAFHQPDHPVSEQYRTLAAEIARQLPGTQPRVLLFTGAANGVGTSTVLLNLAMTLARQDAKVTVVDAHPARPTLAARLGLPDGPGLREVLSGQMPPQWCLQETAHPNLQVLPAGITGSPREGVDLGAILAMLRERSDCVLLDAGPWGDGPAAAELAAGCDAVYLVMQQEKAATPDIAALQEEILSETGRLRGCVITQK